MASHQQHSTRRRVMLGGTAAAALRQLREEHKAVVPVIQPPTPEQHDDTPLHSCTSSSLSEDSFEGSVPDPVTIPAAPHHLQPPTKAPKGTAAAMQRQTMQHVLTQLSQPPSRRLPPRHGRVQGQTHAPACSRNASTSDEDECRCSSSLGGEHSPAVSMHASAAPQPGSNTLRGHCSADAVQDVIAVRSAYNPHRPLARSVSLPSSGNAAHHGAVGPAWLHGNALGCKAMQAVLQQAMPQSMGKRTAGDGRHGDATHAAGGDGRGHGAVAAPQCEPARWLEDVTVEDDKRPWCDMERLMLCITPLMHGNKAPHAITLGDVLQFFQGPSLHGLPIPTHHGSRGPSTAYYVPYLSAMRLFSNAQLVVDATPSDADKLVIHGAAGAAASGACAAGNSASGSGSATTAATMSRVPPFSSSTTTNISPPQPPPLWRLASGDVVKIAAEVFESQPPFVRAALAERLPAVLASSGVSMSTPLAQLHPQSWLAVAWYPIYRIPEAPLAARFLAFYHLTPPTRVGAHHLALPLAALCWHNVQGGTPTGVPQERWLHTDAQQDACVGVVQGAAPTVVVDNPYAMGVVARGGHAATSSSSPSAAAAAPVATPATATTPVQPPCVQLVQQLQSAVTPLAMGAGVVHAGAATPLPSPYFADYDFFMSRRDLNAA